MPHCSQSDSLVELLTAKGCTLPAARSWQEQDRREGALYTPSVNVTQLELRLLCAPGAVGVPAPHLEGAFTVHISL